MLIGLILAVGSKGGFRAGLCSPRKQTPGTKRRCCRQRNSLVPRQHPKTPRTQVLSKAHTITDAARIVPAPRRRGSKGALAVKFSKNGASKGEKKNSSLGAQGRASPLEFATRRDITFLLQRHQTRDCAHVTVRGIWCVKEVGNHDGQEAGLKYGFDSI